jgi:RHS repeat-associated protein
LPPAASDTTNPNPFTFTGREFDKETGLYFHRARYYAPEIGRFLQTDPIGYDGGMNLYTYCMNNPWDLTDPYGRDPNDPNYCDPCDPCSPCCDPCDPCGPCYRPPRVYIYPPVVDPVDVTPTPTPAPDPNDPNDPNEPNSCCSGSGSSCSSGWGAKIIRGIGWIIGVIDPEPPPGWKVGVCPSPRGLGKAVGGILRGRAARKAEKRLVSCFWKEYKMTAKQQGMFQRAIEAYKIERHDLTCDELKMLAEEVTGKVTK